jgi:hypothetical protein
MWESPFSETYGFSARFTVNFWIEEIRFKEPLLHIAMKAVEEAFSNLGWARMANLQMKKLFGQAEPIHESKLSEFFRMKVDPFLTPGTLSFARMMPDSIWWEFQEVELGVTAKVEFYIRKRGFFNKPNQERLTSMIQRLFKQVEIGADKYSLGVTFNRN